MLMEALKPWVNMDHEGVVHPGQRFQAHGPRAVELELAGLAVPVLDEDQQIKVTADPPPSPPPPKAKEPTPAPMPPQPKAKPKHDPKPAGKGHHR